MPPPDAIEMTPVADAINGSIRPPGSKSITNRALVCAALADGESVLRGALQSDDTRVMVDSLQRLGVAVTASEDGTRLEVHGCGGATPNDSAELFIGNSGTTVRFLTAMLAAGRGRFRLDGVRRMRERPIQDLLDALNQLGAHVTTEDDRGCPPVIVEARGLQGGRAEVRGDISSQFLSGLLMAVPYAAAPVQIQIVGNLVSRPYVSMTQQVMHSFGVASEEREETFHVAQGAYRATDYEVEPDASAASYFWAAAAITGGHVRVDGLHAQALQGDVRFCDCLAQMGCDVEYGPNFIAVAGPKQLQGNAFDMNAISDTVQTLAAVALFADGPTRVTGVAHNRHKETDRIGDLACELRKLGATVEEYEDGFELTPGPLQAATIETYDDHRMAMSMSLAGLRVPGVVITNPSCTAKTYPGFFADLQRLCEGRS